MIPKPEWSDICSGSFPEVRKMNFLHIWWVYSSLARLDEFNDFKHVEEKGQTKINIDNLKKIYEDNKRLNMITKASIKLLYAKLADIVLYFFNNYVKNFYSINEPKMNILEQKKNETSIIEFIKIRSGVCRHRSMFFKYLCDYIGLKCRLIRGYYSKNSKNTWIYEYMNIWIYEFINIWIY